MNAKLRELVASRRFWATVLSVAGAVASWRIGIVSAHDAADWIQRALALYTGAVGAEQIAKVITTR